MNRLQHLITEMITGQDEYAIISKASTDDRLGLSCDSILEVFKHGQSVKFFRCFIPLVMCQIIKGFTGYSKTICAAIFNSCKKNLIAPMNNVLKFHNSLQIASLEILRPIMEGGKR